MPAITHTHYVPAFTKVDRDGRQQSVCGRFVWSNEIVREGITPTCWGCAAWLEGQEEPVDDDRADHQIPSRRKLTRHEQLQGLADSGCDTWEEYEGLR